MLGYFSMIEPSNNLEILKYAPQGGASQPNYLREARLRQKLSKVWIGKYSLWGLLTIYAIDQCYSTEGAIF